MIYQTYIDKDMNLFVCSLTYINLFNCTITHSITNNLKKIFRMTTELFAIVQWLNDEDKGTYTVGVPTEWIMQFDYKEYCMKGCDADESYVVEWRQGKKPAGGWLCYDAVVTDVSSMYYLNNK